jgi:hypothetical protein
VIFDVADDTIASVVRTQWDHISTHISARTIRDIVVATMATWGAVRLHRGGVYFVASQHADAVRKLRSAMAAVGTTIYLLPQADIDDSKAALGEAAREHIGGRIQELRDEARRWREASRNPRAGTIESRLEVYSELRASLQDMAEILSVRSGDLHAEIDDLATACKEMLGIEPDEDELVDQEPDDSAEQTEPTLVTAPDTTEPDDSPAPPARPGKPSAFSELKMDELRRKARELSIGTKGLNKQALVAALDQAAS